MFWFTLSRKHNKVKERTKTQESGKVCLQITTINSSSHRDLLRQDAQHVQPKWHRSVSVYKQRINSWEQTRMRAVKIASHSHYYLSSRCTFARWRCGAFWPLLAWNPLFLPTVHLPCQNFKCIATCSNVCTNVPQFFFCSPAHHDSICYCSKWRLGVPKLLEDCLLYGQHLLTKVRLCYDKAKSDIF